MVSASGLVVEASEMVRLSLRGLEHPMPSMAVHQANQLNDILGKLGKAALA